nr:hypothetical protein [Paludibacterium yongneupense]
MEISRRMSVDGTVKKLCHGKLEKAMQRNSTAFELEKHATQCIQDVIQSLRKNPAGHGG